MAGAACPTLKWQDRKTVGRAVPAIKLARLQHNSRSWCTAHIAVNYVLQWSWQLSPDPQTLEQAFAAQKAIALNDSSLWVHPALGSVYLWKKQHDQALAEGERAIALDPNFGEGYATLAEILNYVGRAEEAIGVAEKVIRLFPSNPWYLLELGHAYCLSGRYEEASATLKKLLSRNSNVLPGHLILAIAFSESGREEEARAAATETLRISPKFSLEVWKQRAPYKDPAVVERQLAALRKAGLK
jgi:adenylate cyclase